MRIGLRVSKAVILIVLIVLMAVVFSGPKESQETFETVLSKTQEGLDLSSMPGQDNQKIREIFGLDPESFSAIAYFKIDDVMQANEYMLVQFNDKSQSKAFEDAVQKRIDEQINLYEGYAPDEVQLLDDAIIDVQANYALYVVDDQAAQIHEQFLSSL